MDLTLINNNGTADAGIIPMGVQSLAIFQHVVLVNLIKYPWIIIHQILKIMHLNILR